MFCSLNSLTIEPIQNTDFGKPSWLPAQNAPWLQIEFDKPRPVGLVDVQNQPDNHCSSFWLYIGSMCRYEGHGAPYDTFEGAGEYAGYIVRVSNESCQGESCNGHICSINASAYDKFEPANPSSRLWCNETIGKYVSVQLPGSNRVLGLLDVVAHTTKPDLVQDSREEDEDNAGYICYGLEPKPAGQEGEYEVSLDPLDPIFYSVLELLRLFRL